MDKTPEVALRVRQDTWKLVQSKKQAHETFKASDIEDLVLGKDYDYIEYAELIEEQVKEIMKSAVVSKEWLCFWTGATYLFMLSPGEF